MKGGPRDMTPALRKALQILKSPDGPIRETSFWTLVAAGIGAGCIAVREHWHPIILVWLFMIETVIVTMFSCFRIRHAREFTYGSYTTSMAPNTGTARILHARVAVFITTLLTGFTLAFLWAAGHLPRRQDLLWIAAAAGFMFGHCLLELIGDRFRKRVREHIGNLVGTPALRSYLLLIVAVPAALLMQFSPPLGPIGMTIALCLALLVKLVADILLYVFNRFCDREAE